MMQLLREINGNGSYTLSTTPQVHCKALEDNPGALELAPTPKMRPRTKQINQVYHHFREFVRNGRIKNVAIESQNQISDIFTELLRKNDFLRHRKKLL